MKDIKGKSYLTNLIHFWSYNYEENNEQTVVGYLHSRRVQVPHSTLLHKIRVPTIGGY